MLKRILIVGVVLGLAVCIGALVWRLQPIRTAFYTDADTIRAPDVMVPRDILWQPATSFPEMINTTNEDYEPRMTSDGLTLFFVRGKAGQNADIYVAHRTYEGWTEPKPLGEINSPDDDLGPEPSTDGQSLYFYSNREGGLGGYDLWVTRLGDVDWQSPTNLGPAVNSRYNDYGPAISPQGEILYFSSNRPQESDARQPNPQAWSATLREDLFHRTYDLYASRLTDAGLLQAEPLFALNTPFNEGSPAVSPFDDFLYFASDRPGGEGAFDLFRSRILRGELQPPVNLGAAVNSAANDLDPSLGLGGYRLVFSSDRTLEPVGLAARRDYNLFQTTSREVFREVNEEARAPIDWAALWNAFGSNLLWALLALLLLTLLPWFARGMRGRRLNLMAKCLLASMFAHLLLMLLFNVWNVASGIAGEWRRGGGPIQVAIGPASSGSKLFDQIRGELGERPVVPMPTSATPRSPSISEQSREAAVVRLAVAKADARDDRRLLQQDAVRDVAPRDLTLANSFVTPIPTTTRRDVTVLTPAGSIPQRFEEAEGRFATADSSAAVLTRAALSLVKSTAASPSVTLEALSTPTAALVRGAKSMANPSPALDARLDGRAGQMEAIPIDTTRLAMKPGSVERGHMAIPGSASQVAIMETEKSPSAMPAVASVPRAVAASGGVPTASRRAFVSIDAGMHRAAAPAGGSFVASPVATDADAVPGSRSELLPMRIAGSLPNRLAYVPPIPSATTGVTATETHRDGVAWSEMPRRIGVPNVPVPSPKANQAAVAMPAAKIELTGERLVIPSVIADREGVSIGMGFESPMPRFDTKAPRLESAIALPPVEIELDPIAPSPTPQTATRSVPPGKLLGMIRGRVTDASGHRPLRNAIVRLDLPDAAGVSTTTAADGTYALGVPDVPEHFALSAARKGFNPQSVDVERDRLLDGAVTVNFALEPSSAGVLVTEALPEVHHLGDNRFDGTINSQFQKRSEGSTFSVDFGLRAEQLPPKFNRAEVRLLAKGVQRRHRLVINGVTLTKRLDEAPEDGGFGEFRAPFDPAILREGPNVFELIAAPSSSDIDDFEFVNVQVRLAP